MLSGCLVLGLCVSVLLPGCSRGSSAAVSGTQNAKAQNANAKNSWEIDKSPVTLSIYFDSSGNLDKTWGKDPVSKKWIEDTGVHLKISFSPGGDNSKLNALIASGTLPDMVYCSSTIPQVQQLAKHDKIWALNDLDKKYNAKVESKIDPNVILTERVLWNSKNLYCAPFYWTSKAGMKDSEIPKNIMGIAVIDKVYQAIGSPKLKTTDDLISMLQKVKQQYPDLTPLQSNRGQGNDGDGNPRLIWKALPMANLSGRFYQDSKGDYHKYWESPDFLSLLKFENALYNDSLIDKSLEFSNNKDKFKSNEYGGKIFCDMSQDADNIDWFNSELHQAHPDENWIMIDPPAINGKLKYANDSVNGGRPDTTVLLITKNCQHPDRAIRWLDYLYSENTQISIVYGLEGQGYTVQEGKPVATKEAMDLYNKDTDAAKNKYGMDVYFNFRINDYATVKRYQNASPTQRDAYKVAEKYYALSFDSNGAESYSENSNEVKLASNMKEYYSSEVMHIVEGSPSNVESEYNRMIAKLKSLGLDTMDKYWTNYFKNQESLKKKYSADLNLK